MNTTTKTLLALAATGSFANAALVATNLDFNTGANFVTPTDWVETAPVANTFRAAAKEANWFGTAGQDQLLLETGVGQSGSISQLLTGTAEAGTYTFSLFDLGVTTFADGNNAVISYGFSSDGINLDLGTSGTVTEGTDIFSSDFGSILAAAPVATYTATGLEANVYLLFTKANATGRSIATVDRTTLSFVAVPEPSSTALLGLGGLALILRRRK